MKIKVYSTKLVAGNGREFPVYWTYLTNAKSEKKSFNLKFKADCARPNKFPCELESVDEQSFSLPKFSKPFKGKDGKIVYPTVWVRSYAKATPFEAKRRTEEVFFPAEDDADIEEVEIESDF